MTSAAGDSPRVFADWLHPSACRSCREKGGLLSFSENVHTGVRQCLPLVIVECGARSDLIYFATVCSTASQRDYESANVLLEVRNTCGTSVSGSSLVCRITAQVESRSRLRQRPGADAVSLSCMARSSTRGDRWS